MSDTPPFNPWASIDSRFEGLDGQMRDVGQRMGLVEAAQANADQERGQLAQQVADMTDAFKAFRTALYSAAALVLVAALTTVLIGKIA